MTEDCENAGAAKRRRRRTGRRFWNGFTRKAFGSFRRRRLNGEHRLDKGMTWNEKDDCNRYK